jgi:MFS family permease
MALMVGMMNLGSSAVFAVIVLFAVGPESTLQLTEPQFGILFATIAAGGIFGGLVSEAVQARVSRSAILTVTVVISIIYLGAPAVVANVWVLGVLYMCAGASNMLWNVITVSFRQRVAPDHMLGRMNSAYRLLAWGTRPLGAAVGGVIGEVFGVRGVFGVVGILSLAVLIPNRAITDEALAAAEARGDGTDGEAQIPW